MPRGNRFRTLPSPRAGLTALAALLPLLACSSSPTETGGGSLTLTTVAQVSYSGITTAGQEVVRDDDRWTRVWSEIHGTVYPLPSKPPIDFSRSMVIVAAMGEQPSGCYGNEVTAARVERGGLHVSILETEPGPACACTLALTRPVHAVRLDRSNGTPTFDVRRTRATCS